MHRPVAASFDGSFPAETTIAASLPRQLNLWIGTLAMLCAAAVWETAIFAVDQPDLILVSKLSCMVMLAVALAGLWMCHLAELDSELAVRQAYGWALKEMNDDAPRAVPLRPAASGSETLGRLLGQGAVKISNFQRRRDTELQANIDLHQINEAARLEAAGVAHRIANDSILLTSAAAQVEAAVTTGVENLASTAISFEVANTAVGRATDRAISLTDLVRTNTSFIEKMAFVAVHASEVAHATHRSVANLNAQSAKWVAFIEQVGEVARNLTLVAKSARAEATRTAPPGAALVADELQKLATTALTMFDAGTVMIAELAKEIAQASRSTTQIGDMVQANHELAKSMSENVLQQGEEIARMLNDIYEGRSGFVTIRESVAAVTRAGLATREAADLVRQANSRLPGHAKQLDNLFRNVPPRLR